MRILVSPDKFKGTATAGTVAATVAEEARRLGHEVTELPLADGGEGTLDALGGPNRTSTVTGPLGKPVEVAWRFDDGVAVIESARCAGLVLAGGRDGNDPVGATTVGVGELLREALAAGARRVLVTIGGVATTDGGAPVVDLVGPLPAEVDVFVACDVRTRFEDAARVFGPQKGADPRQVVQLTERLTALRRDYERRFGRDVGEVPGSGAAGGLGGGLAALGARLVPGFDLVADAVDLDTAIAAADLVITGEGRLDAESFAGKVVGEVAARAARAGRPCVAVVGVSQVADPPLPVVSLVDVAGADRALDDTVESLRLAAREALARFPASAPSAGDVP